MTDLDTARAMPAATGHDPQIDRLGGTIDFTDSTHQPYAATDLERDQTWWRLEATRARTDWPSLAPHLVRRLLELESLCIDLLERIEALEDECSPFARAVEASHQRRAAARQPEQRPGPTPPTIVEAIMHSIRERGPKALDEPANQQRLRLCDNAALTEIDRRMAKLGATK
jgi:hypothetical protein